MHGAILLWGFTGILGKLIELNETLLVWYRMILTTIGLFIYLAIRKRLVIPSGSDLLKISGVGFIVGLHWIFFYGAIKASSVSVTLSCFSSLALFTAILDPVFAGKRPRPEEVLFGLLALIGIYLIFMFQKLYLKGILMSLASAFMGSIFTICNQRFVKKINPEILTFYELGAGMLFLSIVVPVYLYFFPVTKFLPGQSDLVYLLVLSVACTIVPFILSLKALQHVSAFTLNLSVNLEPVYSIVLAILLFHENQSLNAGFYWGTLIILSSVLMHAIYKKGKSNILSLEP